MTMTSSWTAPRPRVTEIRLEKYVRERFRISVFDFIRHKAEVKNRYDYEIAATLGVSSGWIRSLRNRAGIQKAHRFPKKFERIHGKGAVEVFKKIIEDPETTLADAARHFGFSRENARQVYRKIYGFPYTETRRKKRLVRAERRVALKRNQSKKMKALRELKRKIESAGLSCEISDKNRQLMMLENGFKLALKTSFSPVFFGRREYFKFNMEKAFKSRIDFFIFNCRDSSDETYYTIPSHSMPARKTVSLTPQAAPDQSKYAQFKEAWHLIASHSYDNPGWTQGEQ